MTIKPSGSSLKFSEIAAEFGLPSDSNPNNKNSLGAYRISETVGSLTNLPIDSGVPTSGEIKFSDFYSKRLNIVVYYTPTNVPGATGTNVPAIGLNAKNTYDSGTADQIRVLGGYLPRPVNPTDKRIIINVNRLVGAQPAEIAVGNAVRGDQPLDPRRTRCAIRTGNWSATPPASIVIQVGLGAEIYGAGGDGGNSFANSVTTVPTTAHGQNGTSAIGIEYNCTVVNRGYIQCGFGGGGAGAYRNYNPPGIDNFAQSGGGSGGGGAGVRPFRAAPVGGYISAAGNNVTTLSAGSAPGTLGVRGQNGTFRVGGAGGAGGNSNTVTGLGGTGGYFSTTPTFNDGWNIRFGKFTNKFTFPPPGTSGISAIESLGEGLFFDPGGRYFYTCGRDGPGGEPDNFVNRFTMSVPWDVNFATWDGVTKRFSTSTQDNQPRGIFFRPDGTRMYILGGANTRIYQYDLSTAWDVSTSVYNSVSLNLVGISTGPQDFWWKPDGSSLYTISSNGTNTTTKVNQFNIASPANYWNVSSAVYSNTTFIMGNINNNPTGICFKPDGTQMYISGTQNNGRIHQFNLTTPWLVNNIGNVTPTNTTANQNANYLDVGNAPLGGRDNQPRSFFIRQDTGETLYMYGQQTDAIHQYSLTAKSGEGGNFTDNIIGGFSGYPGFAYVVSPGVTFTEDPSSTGTRIGLTTTGTVTT